MTEGYQDAFFTIEVARYPDGKYAIWPHFYADKHFEMTPEDYEIGRFIEAFYAAFTDEFGHFMMAKHPEKLLYKKDAEQRFPDAVGMGTTESGKLVLTKEGTSSRTMSPEEFAARRKKE